MRMPRSVKCGKASLVFIAAVTLAGCTLTATGTGTVTITSDTPATAFTGTSPYGGHPGPLAMSWRCVLQAWCAGRIFRAPFSIGTSQLLVPRREYLALEAQYSIPPEIPSHSRLEVIEFRGSISRARAPGRVYRRLTSSSEISPLTYRFGWSQPLENPPKPLVTPAGPPVGRHGRTPAPADSCAIGWSTSTNRTV